MAKLKSYSISFTIGVTKTSFVFEKIELIIRNGKIAITIFHLSKVENK
jgi:hypothetical protein